MKTLLISLMVSVVCSLSVAAQTQAKQDIQSQVMDAFMGSFAEQSGARMVSLIEELSSSYDKNRNSLFLYWKGYAHYYHSIFYLKNGDRKNAQAEVDKGIEALASIEKKNSEDYALLSLLRSYSCRFLGFPEVVQASQSATIDAERALELDENNPRACYVLANIDFYTPENYGGGKKVEEYALKAVSLPACKMVNPYLPSWGRRESYELLANYYIRKKDMEKAWKYIELGLAEYPDSYVLKSSKAKLL